MWRGRSRVSQGLNPGYETVASSRLQKNFMRQISKLLFVAALAFGINVPASAQPVAAPVPVGKPVPMYLGFEPGGGNDQIMRLMRAISAAICREIPTSFRATCRVRAAGAWSAISTIPHRETGLNVPAIMEFAATELDREALRVILLPTFFGFPFAAPPQLLPEVRAMLRSAFERVVEDAQFMEEARKIKLDILPVRGADLERAVRAAYAASPEAIARAKQLIAPN